MTLEALSNASQSGGGIVMLWVESVQDFVQVNKYELLKQVQSNGQGFLQDHKCYRDKDVLYIESNK
tara:strand:- start:6 stop:203 length:198 start_codon:yes stop_codon:yes gene_type:complete